jgi:hypothetical protein
MYILDVESHSGGDTPTSISSKQYADQKTLCLPSARLLHPVLNKKVEQQFSGWEGCDIVTRENCIPASLKVNNLVKAAVLHLLLGLCQAQPADYLAQLCLCKVLIGLL